MKPSTHCKLRIAYGKLQIVRRVVVLAVLAACAWTSCAWTSAGRVVLAQDSPPDDLNAKSLPLRTALHHDPALASPLERLLSMYRSAGRADELTGIYRAHVAQYPNDPSACTVLVRLLMAAGDPEAVWGLDKEHVYRPLYNVQTVRDVDSPFILAYDVLPQATDAATLQPMLQRDRCQPQSL